MNSSPASHRTRRIHPIRRLIAALAVATSTIALSACTLFAPPQEVTAEAEELAQSIRALDGVTDVTVDVYSRDVKDHPNDWIVALSVDTQNSTSLRTVPSAIRSTISGADVYLVDVVLDVPAAMGVAAVRLRGVGEATEAAATQLRAIAEVESVSVGAWPGTSVEKRSSAGLAQTAAAVRAVEGFGSGGSLAGENPLQSVLIGWDGAAVEAHHQVEIGASGPSDPVLDGLERLGREQSVEQVYAYEAEGFSSLGESAAGRPTINITGGDSKWVVGLLTATVDPAAEARLRPRTAFGVWTPHGMEFVGYVGLPAGSPEPDDVPVPPEPAPASEANPVDPATGLPADAVPAAEWAPSNDPAVLARLSELTGEVVAFLDRTEAIAGISAELTPTVGPCVWNPQMSNGQASSVSASVVLPIFTIADSADAAFAAITSDWRRSGLSYSDRALGLDIYSNRTDGAVIADATIRGTSDGISIRVSSACV
jgi:hypothetical protein